MDAEKDAREGAPDTGASEAASRVDVGDSVLVVVADPRGLALLPRLAAGLRTVTIASGAAAEAAGTGLPRGSLLALGGHVGAFVARLALASGERELAVAQVVLVAADPPVPRARTGVHWLPPDDLGALAPVLGELAALAGTFERAHSVRYDRALCAGGEREHEACGRCVPACPYGAVARGAPDATRMVIDHLACEGCGACTAACPTRALALRAPDLDSFLAGAHEHLSASRGSAPWILAHCGEEGRRFVEQSADLGGAVLALPCLRAVSDAAILGAFALGAAGFALVGCASCKHGERATLLETLERNRLVLRGLGLNPGTTEATSVLRLFPVGEGRDDEARVALAAFASGLAPSPIRMRSEPLEELDAHGVVGRALYLMERRLDPAPPTVALPPGGPYAHAAVDPAACTVCGACATICAPKAFQHTETAEELRLAFRSRSCVACGLCEAICPEDAIRLRPELHLGDDARRHVTVARDAWAGCTVCGMPVFPARALDAIERRLAGAPAPSGLPTTDLSAWLRTCHSCRAAAMGEDL